MIGVTAKNNESIVRIQVRKPVAGDVHDIRCRHSGGADPACEKIVERRARQANEYDDPLDRPLWAKAIGTYARPRNKAVEINWNFHFVLSKQQDVSRSLAKLTAI